MSRHACGTSALTCNNSEAWLKRASNPRCCSLPVTSSGGMGLWYLGTYQRRPQRMDKEAKRKHCCLWPRQRAWSTVNQHLPAMAPTHGQRGGNRRCCSLPVTSSGGMAYSASALTSDDHEEWTKRRSANIVVCGHVSGHGPWPLSTYLR